MKRNTRQHRAILGVFTSPGRPLSPQKVAASAQEATPGLGVAAVYRALKVRVAEGWPVTVAGGTRCELANMGHHRRSRQNCDRTVDIAGCTANLRAMLPQGFVVASRDLTINGTCPACVEQVRS